MRLPDIPTTNDQVTMLNQFAGVNLSQSVQDNQFSAMENMTNDYFPVLGNRRKRAYLSKNAYADSETSFTNLLALCGGKYISYIDEKVEEGVTKDLLYYNDTYICDVLAKDAELGCDAHPGERRKIIMMGAYLCIFPDGLIYNTTKAAGDADAYMSVKNKIEIESGTTITMYPCTYSDSAEITDVYEGETFEGDPEDGDYWFDTSSGEGVLKRYSGTLSSWISVATAYIKIEGAGISEGFKAYDAVKISGVVTTKTYNGYDINGTSVVYKVDEENNNYIVIAGYMTGKEEITTGITLERELPELEYITEMDNRLWGCNSENHELYACKLGDPTNWYCYPGLDSDSYTVTVGQHGIFTGAVTYNNAVYMFMEHGFYKVYGTKPSNYEVTWKPCRGVQQGSSASLTQVGDYLYYKSREGICVYDGSAELISMNLGSETYYEAVAGVYRTKYFVCMRDREYKYRLYCYDTEKGTWTIENAKRIWYMAQAPLGLYLVDYEQHLFITTSEQIYEKFFPKEECYFQLIDKTKTLCYPSEKIYPGDSIGCEEEDIVEWTCTTGDIGLDTPYRHYLKRLDLRLWLDYNAKIKVEIAYDRSEAYEYITEYTCTRKRNLSIPIRVRRCDSLKLRLSGHGEFRLYSIAKIIEDGSDL